MVKNAANSPKAVGTGEITPKRLIGVPNDDPGVNLQERPHFVISDEPRENLVK